MEFENSVEYQQELARALCQAIDFANLHFNNWFKVLGTLRSLGFSKEEVRQMCENAESYDAAKFDSEWQGAADYFDIGTIINVAREIAPNFDRKAFDAKWKKEKPQKRAKDNTEFFDTSRQNLKSFVVGCEGEKWRGLSFEVLQSANCGYSTVYFSGAQRKLPAVIIPNDKGGYVARAIEGKHYKNENPTATTTIYLPATDSFTFILTEGAINGLSILQAVGNPTFGIMASGGTSGNNKVLERLQQLKNEGKTIQVLVAYDNDSNNAGQNATAKLLDKLKRAGIAACSIDITKQPDIDLNDVLQRQGESALAKMVNDAFELALPELEKAEKLVDSLPIDLELPVGFELNTGNGNLSYQNKVISYTPPLITKKFLQGDKVFFEVAFLTGDKWEKITVPAESLADKTKMIALANNGLDVNTINSKAMCTYFAHLIGLNAEKIPVEKSYSQGGWVDDTCTDFIYPNDTKVFGNNFNYSAAFATLGNEEKFKETLLKVLQESAVACLVVGTALAAPLIKPFSISNKQLHLGCRSGSGKTALVKLALAIFGNPRFLMAKFNSTANALENSAVALNGFPSAIDELQSINKVQRGCVDELLYNFERGSIRRRLNRQGTFQPFRYFSGCRITTGEQSLTGDFSNEGAKKRCVEIIDNKILSERLSIEVHRLTSQNYGLFGRPWCTYIKNHLEALKKAYNEFYDDFFGRYPGNFPEHISLVAASLVALQHFSLLLFEPGSVKFEVDEIFEQLPTRQDMQNGKRAIAAVAEFITRNERYFPAIVENGGVFRENHAPFEDYGYHLQKGDILIFQQKLKDCLKDFPNFQAIVRDFAQLEYLETGKDKKRLHQKAVKVAGKTVWGYVFKQSVLFDNEATCERKKHEEIEVETPDTPKDDGYSYEDDNDNND